MALSPAPAPSAPPAQKDLIDRLGKWIAGLTAFVGALAAGNNVIVAKAKEKSEHYAAFRVALTAEERYWRGLYDDYLTIFGKDFEGKEPAQRAKILAIHTLAQREPARFTEFDVLDGEKEQATRSLGTIRASLINSLLEEGAKMGLTELSARSFAGKLDTVEPIAVRPEYSPLGPVAAKPPAPPARRPSQPGASAAAELPTTSYELSPASSTGWDLDLFWCQGANGAANYRIADALGRSFADQAKEGRSIAPGVILGRVRVRPATERWQRSAAVARGTWVVNDQGPGEAAAAAAILRISNEALGADFFTARAHVGAWTKWYVSAFVCKPRA